MDNYSYGRNFFFDNLFDDLNNIDLLDDSNYKDLIFIYEFYSCESLKTNINYLIKLLSVISNKINKKNLNIVRDYLIEKIKKQINRLWQGNPLIPTPPFLNKHFRPILFPPFQDNTDQVECTPGTYILDVDQVVRYCIKPMPGFQFAGKSNKCHPNCIFLWDYLYTRNVDIPSDKLTVKFIVTIQCEPDLPLPSIGQEFTREEVLKLAISTETGSSPHFPDKIFTVVYENGKYRITGIKDVPVLSINLSDLNTLRDDTTNKYKFIGEGFGADGRPFLMCLVKDVLTRINILKF
jgi:hypothetical protein